MSNIYFESGSWFILNLNFVFKSFASSWEQRGRVGGPCSLVNVAKIERIYYLFWTCLKIIISLLWVPTQERTNNSFLKLLGFGLSLYFLSLQTKTLSISLNLMASSQVCSLNLIPKPKLKLCTKSKLQNLVSVFRLQVSHCYNSAMSMSIPQ